MAKKKPSDQDEAIRLKAKQMREAQEKADRRIRNIIIGVVVVVVLAVIAALVFVVQSQNSPSSQSGNQSGSQSASEAVPAQFAGGEPIVVSDKGVGQKDDSKQDLTLYYSYTCHWCAYLENAVGEKLMADAQAGKYNLVLQPVNTAEMAWQGPATSAALVVAAEDPDNFPAFHKALFDYFWDRYQASDASVINNASASVKQVAKLAQDNGISKDVISHFGDSASSYLDVSTAAWGAADVTGRQSLGTPELVFNNKVIEWGQGTPDEIYTQVTTNMKAAGWNQ